MKVLGMIPKLFIGAIALCSFCTNAFQPAVHNIGIPVRLKPCAKPSAFQSSSRSELSMKLSRPNKVDIKRVLGHAATAAAAAVAPPGVAGFAAIGGGVLAGGLHAVSGPDHLAALLPRCIGQRWFPAAQTGALWGLGHGLSGMALGLAAYFLKDRLAGGALVDQLSAWTEVAVGLSLVVIGALGWKEANEMREEEGGEGGEGGSSGRGHGHGHGGEEELPKTGGIKRVFFNGMLHGLSWDGTPSLAPALAFSSWRAVTGFLLAYCTGVVVAMSSCTGLIGEGSVQASRASGDPTTIPRRLSKLSSLNIIQSCPWICPSDYLDLDDHEQTKSREVVDLLAVTQASSSCSSSKNEAKGGAGNLSSSAVAHIEGNNLNGPAAAYLKEVLAENSNSNNTIIINGSAQGGPSALQYSQVEAHLQSSTAAKQSFCSNNFISSNSSNVKKSSKMRDDSNCSTAPTK